MSKVAKFAPQAALLLCGAAAGVVLAWPLYSTLELRAGEEQLHRYSQRVLTAGEQAAQESREAVQAVLHDKFSFCSDEDLTFMRQFVFQASYVRDIGRVQNGHLYCTADVGRLARPVAMPHADIATPAVQITANSRLMISPRAQGIIAVVDDISVVLNPAGFNSLSQRPMRFSGLLYDRPLQRVIHGFGEDFPLSSSEVIAQRLVDRDGVLYWPVCSRVSSVCTVAAAARQDLISRDPANLKASLATGAMLGASFALILILFFSRQQTFQRRLRRAVRKGELAVVYQPIVDLRTERIVGAEALARWTTDSGDVVPPDHFIDVAEKRGFVGEITRLVLQRVTEEMRDLLRESDFRVTVNITTQDFAEPGFFAHLEKCLATAGISARSLGLELTERSTAEKSLVTDAISRLRNSGHAVYIDDFGTGYSSLAYLHVLDVDAIKIDRSFTRTVGTGAVTASVVPQILDMAAQLGLNVVVEGVETREQSRFFGDALPGILGQGWLFGRPMPAAGLKNLVETTAGSVISRANLAVVRDSRPESAHPAIELDNPGPGGRALLPGNNAM